MNPMVGIFKLFLSIDRRIWILLFSKLALISLHAYSEKRKTAEATGNDDGIGGGQGGRSNREFDSERTDFSGKHRAQVLSTYRAVNGLAHAALASPSKHKRTTESAHPGRDWTHCSICRGEGGRCWKCGGNGWADQR
jgi:hypothetical protein